MNKILSLVIPTYNMEKYLRKCLNSLIVGDEQMQLLEVLVINDGSKDSSSHIAHEYESRFPNTFKVIDKENGNYGSCINRGLKEARGKYIKVLDADDSFDTEVLNRFVKYLSSTDDDLIISDYDKVNEEGAVSEHHQYNLKSGTTLAFEDYCSTITIKEIQMHGVTYKTENLRSIAYTQTEGISYTDQEWIFIPMTTIRTFSYFNSVLYLYLIGREGQTMNADVLVKSMKQFQTMVLSSVKRYDDYIHKNSKVNDYLVFKLNDNIRFIYNRALLRRNLPLEELETFDATLKHTSSMVYDLSDDIRVHKLFPYKFVKYYRKHKRYLPFYVNWVYKCLRG